MGIIVIKSPENEKEIEQIHALNYRTFVEEIPQHRSNPDRKLVDPFHERNKYLIAVIDNKLLGMITYNLQRPFSLDKKKIDIEKFIPPGSKVVELRLLAVEKEWRKSSVAYRLLTALSHILIEQGITIAFISATTRQLAFYKKIGFTPFGDLVGSEGAFYQPMYITYNTLKKELKS